MKKEKLDKKQPIAVIDGINYYEESKKMKKEDFVKAHLGIYPFSKMDLDAKTGKLKAGQPEATKKLEAIYAQL